MNPEARSARFEGTDTGDPSQMAGPQAASAVTSEPAPSLEISDQSQIAGPQAASAVTSEPASSLEISDQGQVAGPRAASAVTSEPTPSLEFSDQGQVAGPQAASAVTSEPAPSLEISDQGQVAGPQAASAVTSQPPSRLELSDQGQVAGPQAASAVTSEPAPSLEISDQSQIAGPQAASAVTSEPTLPPEASRASLDADQRALLKAVLNRIVPARDGLPGAGDLDVGASIERTLADSARLRRLFLDGLTDIALTAQRQTGAAFVQLVGASQTAVLESVEQRAPGFFVALVEHTYRGYYTLAAVQRAVGFEPRPPQPLGHQLPPFDPGLLDLQRQRPPFWRHTP